MKKSYKKIVSLSLIGVLVVGVTGTLLIPLKNSHRFEESTISLVTPEASVVLDYDDVQKIEEAAAKEIQTGSYSTYSVDNREGEETTPPPEGETPPPEEETDTADSITQLTAKWIQVAFYSAALSGDFDYDFWATTPAALSENTILKPSTESNWVAPNIVNLALLFQTSVENKFYQDTTAAGKEANIYITELAQNNVAIPQACGSFQTPAFSNKYEMKASDPVAYKTCMTEISRSVDFQLAVLEFLYAYSYLWQATSGAYDYFLTQYLQQQHMAFAWTMPVLSVGQDVDEDEFNFLAAQGITEDAQGDGPDDGAAYAGTSVWLNTTVNNGNTNYPQYASVKEKTMTGNNTIWDVGYIGVTNKSAAAFPTDPNADIWKTTNAYSFNPNPNGTGTDYTTFGKYGLTSLSSPKVVLDSKNNAIVTTTSTSEDGTTTTSSAVSAVTLIYPFVFATEYNPATNTAKQWAYSMYAVETSPGSGLYVNADKATPGAVNIFDILASTSAVAITGMSKETIELYIVQTLYDTVKESLNTKVQKYWNDRGFYIELTGSFYDEYSALIPIGIQKPQ